MEENQEQDMFDLFGLDRDDPLTEMCVVAISLASVKLSQLLDEEKAPAFAFNEFIKAWEYYSFLPETTKEACTEMMEIFVDMWHGVASSEADCFCSLCEVVASGEENHVDNLCVVSLELLEAISVLAGSLPEAHRVFAAAMDAAMSEKISSKTCKALLYILCGRIWYRCLGYSSNEEEALLSEGIEFHIRANADDLIRHTEIYAIQIAAAIEDIIYVRLEKGIAPPDMLALAKEGYAILARFDSPEADRERQDLYERTGISADTALYGGSLFFSQPKQLIN